MWKDDIKDNNVYSDDGEDTNDMKGKGDENYYNGCSDNYKMLW